MNLITLLKYPKKMIKNMHENNTGNEYNYDIFIHDSIGKLINNHKNNKHNGNIKLLTNDIIDCIWYILQKASYISIGIDEININNNNQLILEIEKNYYNWYDYTEKNLSIIFGILLHIIELNDIDWIKELYDRMNLINENPSSLDI